MEIVTRRGINPRETERLGRNNKQIERQRQALCELADAQPAREAIARNKAPRFVADAVANGYAVTGPHSTEPRMRDATHSIVFYILPGRFSSRSVFLARSQPPAAPSAERRKACTTPFFPLPSLALALIGYASSLSVLSGGPLRHRHSRPAAESGAKGHFSSDRISWKFIPFVGREDREDERDGRNLIYVVKIKAEISKNYLR